MEPPLEKVWSEVQAALRKLVTTNYYQLWFAQLRPRGIEGEEAILEVQDEFSQIWLTDNYIEVLRDVLTGVTGRPLGVRFVVNGDARSLGKQEPAIVKTVEKTAEPEPMPVNGDVVFNPRYTFENFIVGGNNSFAHAAALAVSQSPGKSYNPLFVYGGVGLGKTHLLHAVGQYAARHRKGVRVALLSSERFTNEYIESIQTNQVAGFRKKYRKMDVLLIDDVQFLAKKERIQEEFFHTFNALHESRRQIVLTCDQPPSEMRDVEQRLVSRFEWGLVTDLHPPDFETRLAILRNKQKELGVPVSDEIIEFLAKRIRKNVRRLEGALSRVASFSYLSRKEATVADAERLARDVLYEEGRLGITMQVIQKRVADHYDLRLADMSSKRRPEHIAFPRQIAMFLSRELTETSLNAIGEAFGGRDHGTVIHACKIVQNRMDTDEGTRQEVEFLRRQLER